MCIVCDLSSMWRDVFRCFYATNYCYVGGAYQLLNVTSRNPSNLLLIFYNASLQFRFQYFCHFLIFLKVTVARNCLN